MKSGKQRRKEIKLARHKRTEKERMLRRKPATLNTAPCNPELLGPNHSCGDPPFVIRGYYRDIPFRCKDCGTEEIWTATRQKWWYEVAKGEQWTTAVRCNSCRRKERSRKAAARRVHLEGLAGKHPDLS